ncbi:hypothetical protein PHISP_02709 [Aspergillus sp. HF37]|nr:hypothetical protein PHISP_02709 [Aspergillus sp. HF37]
MLLFLFEEEGEGEGSSATRTRGLLALACSPLVLVDLSIVEFGAEVDGGSYKCPTRSRFGGKRASHYTAFGKLPEAGMPCMAR